ncbi:uncharacterized protein N7500_001236 [Penicillium coprophilum]|uniref:uncharacterized protein n=1 Tax=Penicillium coprophilum TaxID=36646 RepID=UPI0023950E8A|nr:uncharacterized protein N7500_001236 [Penicillium coprophilum]KAJ5178537.1 hypothetical protein N7500_001236 [Penicillium coprophilum]
MATQHPARKNRALIACEKCHFRKVRRNVSSKGSPCASCEQDSEECVFRANFFSWRKRSLSKPDQ